MRRRSFNAATLVYDASSSVPFSGTGALAQELNAVEVNSREPLNTVPFSDRLARARRASERALSKLVGGAPCR